jgi:hypothetical protein
MDDAYQCFMRYLNVSDQLIGQSSKELVAETARVLALMVASYQAKYGEVPVEESLRLLRVESLNDEDAQMLANGFETLIGVLGALREEQTPDEGRPVH